MPDVAVSQKYLSELVSSPVPFGSENAKFYTARVMVSAVGSDLSLDPIGTPLISSVLAGNTFIPFVDQDPTDADAQGSSLPNQSPVCLVLGPAKGAGMGDGPIVIADGESTEVTVLFRGNFTVKKAGIDYVTAAVSAPSQADFELQLEKQNISVKAAAQTVDPSFVDHS